MSPFVTQCSSFKGLMDIMEFPTNYFCGADVEQWFPEVIERLVKAGSAPKTPTNTNKFWGFTKVHTYGPMGENVEALSVALEFV